MTSPTIRADFLYGRFQSLFSSCIANSTRRCTGFRPSRASGKRAPDDHAHRVIEVGPPHLLFEADGQGFFGELGHRDVRARPGGERADEPARAAILVAQGCRLDATSSRAERSSYGQNPVARKPYGTISSVGGQRPFVLGGYQYFPIPVRTFLQNITAPSLERRIMKKLNKVASLFATAALATPMSGAFARQAQSVDNWVSGTGLPWKNGSGAECWRDASTARLQKRTK